MNAAEILIAARERIAVPERWTQGEYALDAHGRSTPPDSPNAVCWCSSGAVISSGLQSAIRGAAFKCLDGAMGGIIDFNDHHTHAQVLKAFDRAIELAKQAEPGQSPVPVCGP